MSLDLTRVVAQVSSMVARLKDSRRDGQARLQKALDTLHEKSGDIEALKNKVASAKTSWLVAELTGRPDQRYPAPPPPADFTVLATDGSQIDVDRHRSARCYLLNFGLVNLHYGEPPGAALESIPQLYSEDADLAITAGGGREQPIEGPLLGLKRNVEECRHLAQMAANLTPGSSSLALLDGSLIMWRLEPYPDIVGDVLLHKGFLVHLDDMKKLNTDRHVALASYISYPRSTDVVNVLRVALCPYAPVDCDRHCREKQECSGIAGIRDQELFSDLLADGERSALFSSASKIQEQYGEHKVYFFYLKVTDEVARVEIPQWVATDEGLLNLTHSLVLDQCRRGQGYPVVLSEAHEQAVVTGVDRENFWQLVESASIDEHLTSSTSAKSMSKRTRWV